MYTCISICIQFFGSMSADALEWRYYEYCFLEQICYPNLSVATKNGNESKRFIQSESDASKLYKYKWGFKGTMYTDNSHAPKGKTIRGIKYE